MDGFPPIADLLPHGPPMILLDRIVAADEDGVVADLLVRPDLPLCRDGGLPAHAGLELMAQAIAAYAGLRAHRAGMPVKPGFLLGTRRYRSACDRFEAGQRLRIEVRRSYDDGEMANFDCVIRIAGRSVAEARLNVYQPEDPAAFAAGNHDDR